MRIESKARAYVGKFRTSQAGFEAQSDAMLESRIRPNPERRFNPLGAPVSDLSVVVLSDTHFHIEGRETFDRTAILPTTKAMNAIRRHSGQRSGDWHREVRPTLYNNALNGWPNTVAQFLDTSNVPQTSHVLLIHGGDMGDDALNQAELGMAITKTQDIMDQVGHQFTEAWGQHLQVQPIYAVGNHDADNIAWPASEKNRQIEWFYEKLGLTDHPAAFLQEMQSSTKTNKDKALLVIDTNLLDDIWLKGVHEASTTAMRELSREVDISRDMLAGLVRQPSFFDKLKQLGLTPNQYALLKDTLLYPLVQRHKSEQDEMIRDAQQYQDLVIVGHKPKEAFLVANQCEGDVTVIAGDVHFSYDSERANRFMRFPRKTTKNGKQIRTLLIGGATRGGMGIEFPGKATAFILSLHAEDKGVSSDKIFEISQKPSL